MLTKLGLRSVRPERGKGNATDLAGYIFFGTWTN